MFWPQGERDREVEKNTLNLQGGKRFVPFFKSPPEDSRTPGSRPRPPPTCSHSSWVGSGGSSASSRLLGCRAGAPPAPGSRGGLPAAGTCPAPGPRSAAPAGPAPWRRPGRCRGCWRSAGTGRPGGAQAEGGSGERAALGQKPGRGSPCAARPGGLLHRLFPVLLSRFAPQGGNDLKTSREDTDAAMKPEVVSWVAPPGERPSRAGAADTRSSWPRAGAYCSDIQARDPWTYIFLFVLHFSSTSYVLNFTKVLICDKLEIYKTWSSATGNSRNTKWGHCFL